MDPKVYKNRLPEDLSGGEKQRIGILRAISANPKVLLMDEPFSALDPISKTSLQDLIKKIHDKYMITTVFVTHDMDEALKLADRICVMKNGQFKEKAIQLLQRSTGSYTKDSLSVALRSQNTVEIK